MTDPDSQFIDHALVIVLTQPDRSVEPAWLEALQAHCSGEVVASEGGHAPDGLEVLPGSRGPWWTWLGQLDAERTRHGVLLVAPQLVLPERFGQRLAHALASPDCPALLTLPGNHQAGLDPAAGLLDAGAPIDSLMQAAAELKFSPARLRPERLAVVLAGRASEAIALAESGRGWIYDGLWIRDPEAGPGEEETAPDLRAALGQLRERLGELATAGDFAPLPLHGFDPRPVVLHISHDWGGGVARWIADVVAADPEHNHLVLSAGGRTDGRVHGQWLKLYAAGPGRSCIRQWTLSPAISGTDVEHAGYREILSSVIDRFGVARILVSSLIGHSLDALATGQPTLEMLHDYYPAWPVLDHDPLAFAGEDGRIDLDRAVAESGEAFLFEERRSGAWQQLATAWLGAVRDNGVALAAPTGQVLERWRKLVADPLEGAHVVPHGFAGWPAETALIQPRPLPDGRLNLVVVGRLSAGKGLRLLEAALEELRGQARVTLLGCGSDGMRFFGRPGVDIVLDYRHEDLPRHLARLGAQAALFLSTVAETWNYVLSETRSLGLVPLATRTGSFVERIRHEVDGLLFEPNAASLVQAVQSLREQPERLEAMRRALPAEPPVSGALSSIEECVGLEPARPRGAAASSGAELQAAVRAARLADSRLEHRAMRDEIEALRRDLERRTDWARKQERLAGERTNWAKRLESELDDYRQEVADKLRRLEVTESELESMRNELQAQRGRTEHLEEELQTIFASRSWRMTRPMRVTNRIVANALRRRVYNPLRWPRMLARLFHNLRLYGARGTLELMQQGAPPRVAMPEGVETVEAPGETLCPVCLEPPDEPVVSIVVPVFNKAHYTSACLNSIAARSGTTPLEVIVVDDCSTDDTAEYLAQCRGVVAVRNETNSGFIASCNAGAEAAKGRYLVFLNNDTTVTDGWIEALVQTFASFPDTGIVGARLVYPDGRLQEAGGIVFNDGSGWNYGRGDDPDRPEYNFACQADYVSGACLGIERTLFARLGGFDKHYAPAYYEDTDLCFRVREAGLRVIYQPACTIVHHEGISSGTDESSGTKRYQAVNREKFLARWKNQLARQPEPVPGPEAVEAVYRARHHRARGHVLVIDATTPEPDKDSGSMRMVAMLTILRDLGYRVSFVPENLAWVARYTRQLQTAGVEVLHQPWSGSIEEWLARHGARLDQVLVSRHYVLEPLMPVIRRHCRDAALVFDTVDLHFLREERMAEIAGDEKAARIARKTREAELSLIRQADATLVVSPVEQELLRELVPDARIRVLSNIHRIHGRRRGWSERRDLLFVGGFQHPPNLDAAEWLIDEIMPLVRNRIPEARLHLIGSRMPESLRERRSEGVVVHGYVADLGPYLEGCRLSVAPLRYGAGVKGKVNQAMAWGLPVVATGCAAEGMYLEDGEDVLVADTSEAFAEAVVRAYEDEALWLKLSDGGLANVEKHFSFDAARRAITELLEALKTS
ncbi:glycosyltransferase [Wenzhouxiangella sediminis]|uniref:Glycosyltransferase n=1 Tax=Wenzhouxiangella sediminis TaxID=1792836 RepID=A0A3E1K4Y7_9GAMM|nr:glycosyltransferase [Wenzhouxiangella sediminis]RFF29099.1 glycosyltransferase [Wenzhouxiangella sediminis]